MIFKETRKVSPKKKKIIEISYNTVDEKIFLRYDEIKDAARLRRNILEGKSKGIVIKKRNIIAIIVWCILFLALVSGITLNAVLYHMGKIQESDVYRRLWYAVLCLVMMSAVYAVELLFRIRFSLWLELALSIFAFAALAGGTVFNLYVIIPVWDKILHALSGPLFCIVGLSFATLLLADQPTGKRKVVAFIVIALFFALAVGYVWEMFEYTVDSVIPGYDNQRWLAGVIEDLGDGTYLVSDRRGSALHDTMWDMICNFLGSVLFLIPTLIVCLKKPERTKLFRLERTPKKVRQSTDNENQNE